MHAFTSPELSWALSGIVLASGLGAVIMCLLVLLQGVPRRRTWDRHPSAGAGPGATAVLLGHAAAGVCFAIATVLAVVVIAHQSRAAATLRARGVEPPRTGPADVARLQSSIAAIEERLARTEQQASAMDSRLTAASERLESTVRGLESATSRAASAETRSGTLQGRLDAAESRLAGLEGRLQAAETSARQAGSEAGRALSGLKQVERAIAAAPPARPAAARDAVTLPTPPARPAPPRAESATQERPHAGPAPRGVERSPGAAGSRAENPPRGEAALPRDAGRAPAEPRPRPEALRAVEPSSPAPTGRPPAQATPGTWPRPAEQDGRGVAAAPPARSSSTTAASTPAPEPPGVTDRLRSDWDAIKRDAETTNAELRKAWERIRDYFSR